MKQLNKIQMNKESSQIIGEFLEWLRQKEIYLCEEGKNEQDYIPILTTIEQILAEYFEIDLVEAEKERKQILEDFRNRKS